MSKYRTEPLHDRTIPRHLRLNPDKDKELEQIAIQETLDAQDLEANAECLWHKMTLDAASTTFKDVRSQGMKDHPLYPCIDCDGYGHPYGEDRCCDNYRPLYEIQ